MLFNVFVILNMSALPFVKALEIVALFNVIYTHQSRAFVMFDMLMRVIRY